MSCEKVVSSETPGPSVHLAALELEELEHLPGLHERLRHGPVLVPDLQGPKAIPSSSHSEIRHLRIHIPLRISCVC